jgi:hypothetical protein
MMTEPEEGFHPDAIDTTIAIMIGLYSTVKPTI